MRVYASDPVIRHGSAPRRGRLRYDAAKVKPPMAGGQPLNKALGSMRKLIALLISMAAFPVMAADACQKQIPSELGAQIEKAYPQFRTPLVTDNLDEDVAYSKKATGNACLGVASADFDGDGVADRVIGLTALTGPGALVVVALSCCICCCECIASSSLSRWIPSVTRSAVSPNFARPSSRPRLK